MMRMSLSTAFITVTNPLFYLKIYYKTAMDIVMFFMGFFVGTVFGVIALALVSNIRK